MIGMPKTTLPGWANLFIKAKLACVQEFERGDMPPLVAAERNGEVLAVAMAPNVHRDLGIRMAGILRNGFDADTLYLGFDAHMAQVKDAKTEKEAIEEYHRRFPKGQQHACDHEGACERGDSIDLIIVHRYDGGKAEAANVPYHYHGRGTTFRWAEDRIQILDESSGMTMGGVIHDAVKDMLAQPAAKDLRAEAAKMGLPPQLIEAAVQDAALHTLAVCGCLVFDYRPSRPKMDALADLFNLKPRE